MKELKDRGVIILILVGFIFLIFIGRLFHIQVLSSTYSMDNDAYKKLTVQPVRGLIYNRNNEIYVQNTPIFNVLITPRELEIPDTTLLEEYLGITREEIRLRIKEAKEYSKEKPSILAKQIDAPTISRFKEHMYNFRGISIETRNQRDYNFPVGGNYLGYISEVNDRDIENSNGYYRMGDLTGTSGLERQYEWLLRGRKGTRTIIVDVHGREVGKFAEGKYDTVPEAGKDVMIGIDTELQALGELLMQNKIGSIVALEPATGEVLAFVSSPTYNPNLLTGRDFGKNYLLLEQDSLKPLYNRPLMAMYPPGSTFKLANAMAGQVAGTLNEHTRYGCAGGWTRNGGKPGCHGHPSPLDLRGSVQHSCNAYYASVYYDLLHSSKFPSIDTAFQIWHDILDGYAIGKKTGIDIPHEKPGFLPTLEFYQGWYKYRWNALTVISNSIGQGEILMTPLQLANMAAIFANRGYFYTPHFLKAIRNETGDWEQVNYDKIQVPGTQEQFQIIVDGMQKVVEAGTARRAWIGDSLLVCGKTGTAQNPHGDDHSIFVAFAPMDNPRIAVSVIVENSGNFGGTWAAPMASLMIQQYLLGNITNEIEYKRILEANFIDKKK